MREVRRFQAKPKDLRRRILNPGASSFNKYKAFVLGASSLSFLLLYEMTTTLLGSLPGVMGLYLRRRFFPLLLKKTGKNVVFGKSITLRHPQKIAIGDNVVIDDYCVLDAKGEDNEGIFIGDNVFISRNTVIGCKGGDITIGHDSSIGTNCVLHSETSLTVGNYVLIAASCYVVAGGSHGFESSEKPMILQQSVSKGGVAIKDDVWIGAGVCILDGSVLEGGNIVAAGAVVNGNLPPNSIAGGIPAKVIRMREGATENDST